MYATDMDNGNTLFYGLVCNIRDVNYDCTPVRLLKKNVDPLPSELLSFKNNDKEIPYNAIKHHWKEKAWLGEVLNIFKQV